MNKLSTNIQIHANETGTKSKERVCRVPRRKWVRRIHARRDDRMAWVLDERLSSGVEKRVRRAWSSAKDLLPDGDLFLKFITACIDRFRFYRSIQVCQCRVAVVTSRRALVILVRESLCQWGAKGSFTLASKLPMIRIK